MTTSIPNAGNTRTERDSFGPIEVPADALWGAQTARSLQFFAIGSQRMPAQVIHALAWIKCAAAHVNADLGRLDASKAKAIAAAARQVAEGRFDAAFPLVVWQTGSGTQSNMNVNEVVANLASEALGGPRGIGRLVHPNDDVNLGQSSNDVFPSAMHIAAALALRDRLLPALRHLRAAWRDKATAFGDIIKVGRTHAQDATPVTFGQEFGGYEAQLALCEAAITQAANGVQALAIGGTAVGTGLNTPPDFGPRVAAWLGRELGLPLRQADNLFAALAGHEPLVLLHGTLRALAVALTKIGSDVRLMGSGPRAGIGELQLPENGPGSSIMPGKVNPVIPELVNQVCYQVMGYDLVVSMAAEASELELCMAEPIIAYDLLHGMMILKNACITLVARCITGIEANRDICRGYVDNSIGLVTALVPVIGYELSAAVAREALQTGASVTSLLLDRGLLSREQLEDLLRPENMTDPREIPR